MFTASIFVLTFSQKIYWNLKIDNLDLKEFDDNDMMSTKQNSQSIIHNYMN